MSVIEVERKFSLTPPARAALLSLPAARFTHALSDRYYRRDLALSDRWLRRRNGQWELKLPVPGAAGRGRGAAAVYRELAGAAVWVALGERAPPEEAECFAALETLRTEMALRWKGFDVTVTLDECAADHGFECSVGELEILVADEDEVEEATTVLEDLFGYLEVSGLEDREGKLIRYIRQHDAALFGKLQQLNLVPS